MKADPTKTRELAQLKHERQLLVCRFSPCGQFVFAGSIDNRVLRWDLEAEKPVALEGHESWVAAMGFAEDRLATADLWGSLRVWQYADGKPLWTVENAHDGWVRGLSVSPDGKMVVTCGTDKMVRAWSMADGKAAGEFAAHEDDVFSVAFHADGESFVSGDQLGVVHQWEMGSERPVRTFDASALFTDPYDDDSARVGGVRRMAFSRDGTRLACGGMTNAESATFAKAKALVMELDWEDGTKRRDLAPKFDGTIKGLDYLEDGTLVAAAEGAVNANAGQLWFWPPDGTEPLHALPKVKNVRDLAVHPDGLRLALACFEPRGRIGNGRRAGEYLSHAGSVRVYEMAEPPNTDEKK